VLLSLEERRRNGDEQVKVRGGRRKERGEEGQIGEDGILHWNQGGCYKHT
jgi:hypothetical protein